MSKSFRECAAHYLDQWYRTDQRYVKDFSGGPVEVEQLSKMCRDYKVARTVPGKGDERSREFAEMLERYRNRKLTTENAPEIISKETEKMREVYGNGKRFLSAITKAFWMMKGHPVAIYDSNVRRGLRMVGLDPGGGDYCVYYRSWFEYFERKDVKRDVGRALEWLQISPCPRCFMGESILSPTGLRKLVRSERFRNRVVDMHLFFQREK